MSTRWVRENAAGAYRLLWIYAAIGVTAAMLDRAVLAARLGGGFPLRLMVLCVASLAAVTYCAYHVRRTSFADRLVFVVFLTAINAVCAAVAGAAGGSVYMPADMLGRALDGAWPTFVAALLWLPLADRLVDRWRTFIEPGRCAACGYDLTGNVSGRCPECGQAFG